MLYFPLIEKNQDFIKYLYDNSLTSSVVFVTPNPQKADVLRYEFEKLKVQVDSVTISKFIKDILSDVQRNEGCDFNLKGKSELMVILGAIWKKMNLSSEYSDFKRSFNLITEFRSFSTELSVLETVLENYEPEVQEGVLWLHRFMEQLEIVDEHKSYGLVANLIEQERLELSSKKMVFFGFDFITGSQIDLFKKLSMTTDVYIPIYKDVYDRCTMLDWPSWFQDEEFELIESHDKQEIVSPREFYSFSKNYLGKAVTYVREINQFDSLLLGIDNLNSQVVQELPLSNISTKYNFELFEDAFLQVYKRIESSFTKEIKISDFLELLDNFILRYVKESLFRQLKVVTLFKTTISYWKDLTDSNQVITKFDLKVFNESVRLDLPRVNLASLNSKIDLELHSMKSIESVDAKKALFTMSSDYEGLGIKKNNYVESLEKYLASVGPIRRSEFDRMLIKAKLKEFMAKNEVVFLIESKLFEHDADLNLIFSEFEFPKAKTLSFSPGQKKYLKSNYSKHNLSSLSATKLQRYIDCPRKYALSYIDYFSKMIKINKHLSSFELGKLQHSVIESYFQTSEPDFNEVILNRSIHRYLKTVINENSIEYKKYFFEIKSFTLDAIKYLLELKREHGVDLLFEVPFESIKDGIKYTGSVDCLIKFKDSFLIVDFKRSNHSFTSYKSLLTFDQIQLWFYLNRLKFNKLINTEKVGVGYIDLSEIENSVFVLSCPELFEIIKSHSLKTKSKYESEFSLRSEEYTIYENEIIEKLQSESNFFANPKSEKSCQFCINEKVCSRKDHL